MKHIYSCCFLRKELSFSLKLLMKRDEMQMFDQEDKFL